jgi:hypothetical protein
VHSFTTLFASLDARIADVVEDGIARQAYFTRANVPLVEADGGRMVAPARERSVPLAEADHTHIVALVRDRLRPPAAATTIPAGAARSRAELHAAIVHQPERRDPGPSLST